MDKTLGDVWDWEQTEGEEGEEGGKERGRDGPTAEMASFFSVCASHVAPNPPADFLTSPPGRAVG